MRRSARQALTATCFALAALLVVPSLAAGQPRARAATVTLRGVTNQCTEAMPRCGRVIVRIADDLNLRLFRLDWEARCANTAPNVNHLRLSQRTFSIPTRLRRIGGRDYLTFRWRNSSTVTFVNQPGQAPVRLVFYKFVTFQGRIPVARGTGSGTFRALVRITEGIESPETRNCRIVGGRQIRWTVTR